MIMVSQRFSFQLVFLVVVGFLFSFQLVFLPVGWFSLFSIQLRSGAVGRAGGSGLLLLVALSSPNSFIFVCANVCKHMYSIVPVILS